MPQEHRIFVELPDSTIERAAAAESAFGVEFEVVGEDRHHLINVLRVRAGSQLTVVAQSSASGLAHNFDAVVVMATPKLVLRLVRLRANLQATPRVQALILPLLKGAHTVLACEKAVELGVDSIILYQAARGVAKLPESAQERENRLERWQRIVEQAASQSKKECVPPISLMASLSELPAYIESTCGGHAQVSTAARYVCALGPDLKELRDIERPSGKTLFAVGPEGDFSPEELLLLSKLEFRSISLGPTILRSETAAITAVALANGIWGYLPREKSV